MTKQGIVVLLRLKVMMLIMIHTDFGQGDILIVNTNINAE